MRIQIEILNFEDSSNHRTVIAKKDYKDSETIHTHPTIVIVSGKGVISKSYVNDKTIVQRVNSNDSLYYTCDHENKEISFVRKEQVDSEIDQFSKVLYIKICSKIDDIVIKQTISEFYTKIFTLNNLLKYKDDGKIILSHLIKKIEIPLLISVFAILLINFFVNSHLSDMNNDLQAELMKNKKNISDVDFKLKEIQKLKMENTPNRSLNASVIIDALASQLPNGITLNYFAVDPLRRKVETQKKLHIEKNTIVISGETLSANDITEMTNNIENLDFTKDVKIKNIEQKEDNGILVFEIEVTY